VDGSQRTVAEIGGGRGARSGACFVDHFFPNAFGLEDQFDEFAGGNFAAGGRGGVVLCALHIRQSVFRDNGEPRLWHVDEIPRQSGDWRSRAARRTIFSVFTWHSLTGLSTEFKSSVELEPAYWEQVQFPFGSKIGPGPHCRDSRPASRL
jgi:hypothetical protein